MPRHYESGADFGILLVSAGNIYIDGMKKSAEA
jgi:hypothetical protein